MADRLDHPERDADDVGGDDGGDAEEERHREVVLHDRPHRLVVAVGGAEIAAQQLPHPLHVALVPGLVEAVVLLELLDLRFGERLTLAGDAAAAAGGVHLLRFHDGPLERSAGHEAGDDEDDEGDAEEGGRDEQHAS